MRRLELDGVGKRFRIDSGTPTLMRRIGQAAKRARKQELWALRGVTFGLDAGETIGVIGRNGAGKTTLIRVLSGVSAPTEGTLRVRGRIAPLIGVGVGFNPELTGRENVLVNGQLLGLTEKQVRDRFDSIVAFSEIESFLESPVKYYSSGMFLRLAFAVAIHTEPEVMLVDEILAVGDMGFQLKCNDKLREIQQSGASILVVTHNLEMLSRLTARAIVMHGGRMQVDGTVEDAISTYQDILQREQERDAVAETGVASSSKIAMSLHDANGTVQRHFNTGDRVRLKLRATLHRDYDKLVVMAVVQRADGEAVSYVRSNDIPTTHGPDKPLDAELDLTLNLLSGDYAIRAMVFVAGQPFIAETLPMRFSVTNFMAGHGGIVDMAPTITVDGAEMTPPRLSRLEG
ncbi:MAG TPA: polysaccharide ABC transporter ATP-binding protein [Mycobacteriales bacterium]|nr:polysaccharide ABC transporter ATP-binding protein [Mycobacteriales bacterium]